MGEEILNFENWISFKEERGREKGGREEEGFIRIGTRVDKGEEQE